MSNTRHLSKFVQAVATASLLAGCGMAHEEVAVEPNSEASAVASALTEPPEEAGFALRGVKLLLTGVYDCVQLIDGVAHPDGKCETNGAAQEEFAVYDFGQRLELCIPGTLERHTRVNPKARDLETYEATCLQATHDGLLRAQQQYILSWRRLGSSGPFEAGRRGSFVFTQERGPNNFGTITDSQTGRQLTRLYAPYAGQTLPLSFKAPPNTGVQDFIFAYFVACDESPSGQCMKFN